MEKNTIKLHKFGKETKMIHVNKKRRVKKEENIIYHGGNIIFNMHKLSIS